MNESELIFDRLRQLDIDHRDDGDGGYGLVRAIRNFAQSLDMENRESFWDILFTLVEQQDATLWGVALEVLVQENLPEEGGRLSSLLGDDNRTDEWKDQIVLAVLRLSHLPSAPMCVSHIRGALQKGRRTALPILAALCHVDAEACITLAAEYFGRVADSDDFFEKHQGYIPAFVRNFLEVDERLFRRLLERINAINPAAGEQLVQMLEKCLARPFFIQEIGRKKIVTLRESISKEKQGTGI